MWDKRELTPLVFSHVIATLHPTSYNIQSTTDKYFCKRSADVRAVTESNRSGIVSKRWRNPPLRSSKVDETLPLLCTSKGQFH
jgi:hypothetical protein